MKKSLLTLVLILILSSNSRNVKISNSGYNYLFSGTYFPPNIGNFSLLGPRIYDKLGLDVGVGYFRMSRINLTHYIYPSIKDGVKTDLNEHFQTYKDLIKEHSPDAKLIEEGNFTANTYQGKYAKYELRLNVYGFSNLCNSYFYLFEDKGWFNKLSITYDIESKEINESKDKEIENYIKNMPWQTVTNKN